LTIDLEAVVANWRMIRDRAAPAQCAAVVKADGYGLGAAPVAAALAAAGCTQFVVAQPEEALALRAALPEPEILCLTGPWAGCEAELAARRITPTINHLEELARWQALGRRLERPLPAWIHLDTGMNRLGLDSAEWRRLVEEPERLAGLELRGWLSHLACADQRGHPMNPAQLGRFHRLLAQLPKARRSLANSSGLFRSRAYHLDLVRPGAALYGVNPTPEAPNPMAQPVRLEARILQVRTVDSGMTVGYGATHTVARAGRIATIAIGYEDGFLRALGDRGFVVIAGHAAPVVGRISMDLITVDVTGLPEAAVTAGGWAEIIGAARTVDDIAWDAGTIGYEILTSLGRRCHRIWRETGSNTEALP
jgi:alanine racemase